MYKVAILCATYNGSKYIKEQIDSLVEQINCQLTIYFSDDMSKDNTLEIIKSYDNKNIVLLSSAGRMGSASQNFFRLVRDVDFSDYDYIAFSDQDDIWYKDKLYRAIKAIEAKGLDGYSSNVTAFWSDGKRRLIDKSANEVKYDFLFGSAGPGCTIVLKQDIMEQFKEKIIQNKNLMQKINLHDWIVYAYIRSKKLKWWVDPLPSMDYRQHQSNEFGANSGLKSLVSRWEKARNGWYRKQILLTSQFCELEDLDIVHYLKENTYLDRLLIIKDIFSLRKKKSEALFLALVLLIPGFR